MNSRKTSLIVATLACTGAIGSAQADTIYSETLNNVTTTTALGVNNLGWTATRSDGLDLSTAPAENEIQFFPTSALLASGTANLDERYALISDASPFDPAAYENDLTISISQNATDVSPSSAESFGWRILVQVGSAIYASDYVDATYVTDAAAFTTLDFVVSGTIWHLWTGETDVTNGFAIASIAGTATTLPAGSISKVGVLAIDGPTNNDRMRLASLTITGSVVPEPGSLALMGLGGLLMVQRRRRD